MYGTSDNRCSFGTCGDCIGCLETRVWQLESKVGDLEAEVNDLRRRLSLALEPRTEV